MAAACMYRHANYKPTYLIGFFEIRKVLREALHAMLS
jgi:hypothetical protein